MTFRTRIALAAAVAVVVTVTAMAAVAFLLLRGSLTGSVDQTLRARAAGLTHVAAAGDPDASTETREEVNRAGGLAQIVNGSGRVLAPQVPSFPVPSDAAPVARGQGSSALSTVGTGNAQVRVLTISLGNGTALEVGISLDEFRRSLRVLALDLALVALAGIILAGVVGWLVARTALVPLDRLTGAIDAVAATTDLSHRIEVDGSDELARLGADFNRVLEALEQSRSRQRQLVADASHELRTPLTSLRTNIEVLQRADELEPAEIEGLRSDVLAQIEELTTLIGDVVELARGDASEALQEEVELGELVAAAVARTEVHGRAAGVGFKVEIAPSRVLAVPARLERAVTNLLDNAVQWSPEGGVVEVESREGTVTVRDHGPGIPPENLPHVFDRFYRASAARGRPGSGLGLAIVREVVEAAGGRVWAANHLGGGAILEIHLPVIRDPAPPGP